MRPRGIGKCLRTRLAMQFNGTGRDVSQEAAVPAAKDILLGAFNIYLEKIDMRKMIVLDYVV